jgi:hypothetical protein
LMVLMGVDARASSPPSPNRFEGPRVTASKLRLRNLDV